MMKIKDFYRQINVNNKICSYTFSDIYFIKHALKN